MSAIVGNFDCAKLLHMQVKIEQIWADSVANKAEFYAKTLALNTIIENQTAQLTPLADKDKIYTMKIVWLADCADDAPIETDDRCAVGGATIGTDCKEYTMGQFAKRKFTVPSKVFETSMYSVEEVLARIMLKRMKQLDEEITQSVLADVLGFAGVNKFTGGSGTVVANDTYIKSALWDANLMGYFAQVQILNRFINPYLLSGNNLFQQAWQIALQQKNAQDGAADAAKMATMKLVNDLFTMEAVAPGETALIDSPSVAFVSRARNSSTPVTISNGADITFYSLASKNIKGLVYDVSYKTRCENDEILHDFGITAHFDVFQNPLGCDPENTGILTFKCGSAP